MRRTLAVISFGVLAAVPGTVSAVSGDGLRLQAVTGRSATQRPTHSMRGIVTSIDASSIVIAAGSGKRARVMTFVLGPSTQLEGEITIGATVSVRYRVEGRTLMSTAVFAHADTTHAPRAADRVK